MSNLFQFPKKYTLTFHDKVLDLSKPKVMGVLNVTPDSFSDGGRYHEVKSAVDHAKTLIAHGVDILDIGGESTRPNAPKVATQEELSRVIPVVEAIRRECGDELWLSIDTSNPIVMQASLEAGADMINDVRALRKKGAPEVVAKFGCPVVMMHSRGEPTTMDNLAAYQNVVKEVIDELEADIQRVTELGVCRQNIIVDVGMGFAKNYEHHKVLMTHLASMIQRFDLPMLFGVSRKRFLAQVLTSTQLEYVKNHDAVDRDNLSTIAHLIAIQQGVHIVRVHDVKHMVQAVALWQALLA